MSTFDFLLEDDCMKDTSCDDISKGRRDNGPRRGDRRQPFNRRGNQTRGGLGMQRPFMDDNNPMGRKEERAPLMNDYSQSKENSSQIVSTDVTITRRDRPKTVERTVMYNLNKMTVENFHTACESIVTSVIETMGSEGEMERIAEMIVHKALHERENMETYADVIQILYWRLYEPDLGYAPLIKTLVQIVTNYAQEIPPVLKLNEEQMKSLSKHDQAEELAKIRERTLAITACLGHFLVRGLIKSKIWKNLMKRLLYAPNDDTPPADHCIEGCAISVLACGHYLDTIDSKSNPDLASAKYHLDQTVFRLQHLMSLPGVSQRAKILVRDLLETRDRQWRRKIHTDRPSTMKEIADEHERDRILGGTAIVAQLGKVERVGERRKDKLQTTDYSLYYLKEEAIFKDKMNVDSTKNE